MHSQVSHQHGFSLVELLVALVVTMLIAGGIFGLLYDSNRTFGREPAVSEMQQNGRIALSLVEADLISAGAGAGAFMQVFTDGLDNTVQDSSATPRPSPLSAIVNDGANRTDALELRGAVDECSTIQLCTTTVPGGNSFTTMEPLPACMPIPGLVVITDNAGHSYTLWACVPGGGTTGSCAAGPPGPNGHVLFTSGAGTSPSGCTAPGVPCNTNPPVMPSLALPAWMTAVNMVRYEVRMGADGVPSLWRSPTAGLAADTSGACSPNTATNPNADQDWRLVARGIEDLQVRYRNGGGAWTDTPGVVACQGGCAGPEPTAADWDTVVREVEVRISARVVAPRQLQGEVARGGVTARRTELRTVISPGAAVMALRAAGILL